MSDSSLIEQYQCKSATQSPHHYRLSKSSSEANRTHVSCSPNIQTLLEVIHKNGQCYFIPQSGWIMTLKRSRPSASSRIVCSRSLSTTSNVFLNEVNERICRKYATVYNWEMASSREGVLKPSSKRHLSILLSGMHLSSPGPIPSISPWAPKGAKKNRDPAYRWQDSSHSEPSSHIQSPQD